MSPAKPSGQPEDLRRNQARGRNAAENGVGVALSF